MPELDFSLLTSKFPEIPDLPEIISIRAFPLFIIEAGLESVPIWRQPLFKYPQYIDSVKFHNVVVKRQIVFSYFD